MKKYTPEMEADIIKTRDRIQGGGHEYNKVLAAISGMLKRKYGFEPGKKSIHMKLIRMREQTSETVVVPNHGEAKSMTIKVKGVEITVLCTDK